MASGMKLLNADGHGVAFAPLQIKSLNDTKSLAVDTVCIAYTLATWHGAIKNQSNHMQRCTLINELKVAIAERGSTLTTELTNILVAAEKVDFAVERKDAQEEREERKEAAKKQRWKRAAVLPPLPRCECICRSTTLLLPLSRCLCIASPFSAIVTRCCDFVCAGLVDVAFFIEPWFGIISSGALDESGDDDAA